MKPVSERKSKSEPKVKTPAVKQRSRRHLAFGFTKNSIIYLLILIASLIFTQALRSYLSNIFFAFIVMLPFLMLFYVLIARVTLSVFKISDSKTVEKMQPCTYQFKMINSGIFPYPFIDAYMELPQKNSVRTGERLVRLSMMPFCNYEVKNTVCFRFRGTYEMGVEYFYVYDLFRMFRMRIDFDNYDTVYVLPRKLFIEDGEAKATSDEADLIIKSAFSYDRVEISDIREYRLGDSLKSIHWKLSSKSEEFIVRDFDSGSTHRTYIFADMSARFPNEPPQPPESGQTASDSVAVVAPDASELAEAEFYEDMNEFCADGVCELTVATVLRELRAGNVCSLFWFDSRSDAGVCGYTLTGIENFSLIYKIFATAPLCTPDNTLTKLSSMVKDTQNVKLLYVTAAIDPGAVSDYSQFADVVDGLTSGAAEVILYSPYERFKYPHDRRVYVESCRQELTAHGLKLTDGKLSETPVADGRRI